MVVVGVVMVEEVEEGEVEMVVVEEDVVAFEDSTSTPLYRPLAGMAASRTCSI